MEKLKIVLKRILITYLILYIILTSMSTCFARTYDSACGEYVSNFARDFIATYCTPETKTQYVGISEPNWTGGSIGQGTFQCCCSTGVKYMYELALEVNIYNYDFSPRCSEGIQDMASSPYWTDVTNQTLQPGDVVICPSHTEMYIGNNENANFGNDPHSGKIANGPRLGTSFTKAFRLTGVEVDPSGKVTGAGVSSGTSVNYSKFFFNGIPDGTYSVASRKNIFETIIDALANILNYLIGILTYIFRLAAIGWIALADRLLNNTVNSITNPNIPAEGTIAPAEVINLEKDERHVTIETLLYNQLDLFNVNIFE